MSNVAPDGTVMPDSTPSGWFIYPVAHEQPYGENNTQTVYIDVKRWVGKTPDANNPPTWDDSFQKWDQWHIDTYGITIDRKWSADDGTIAAKLAIDTDYIQSVQNYNTAFGKTLTVDTRYLGPNVQPNPYTPKPEWSGYLKPMLPVIGVMLALAGVPLMIGSAALGAIGVDAAAMPLAAQAVGNMAVSTAMNGGDVSKAVTGALVGMAASGVGDYVGTASETAKISKTAADAVQSTLKVASVGDTVDYSNLFDGIEATPIIDSMAATQNTDLVSLQDVLDANSMNPTNDFLAQNDLATKMADTYNAQVNDQVKQIQSAGNPNNIDLSKLTIKDTNSFLRDAAALLTTVKALAKGSPVPYVSTSLPVGVPQLQSDGSYKVNNGNGTVTTHYTNGTTQTLPLVSTGGFSLSSLTQGNTPLYIGGAVLAVLLLRR